MICVTVKLCPECRMPTTHYIISGDNCRATICLKCAERINADAIGVAECLSNIQPVKTAA